MGGATQPEEPLHDPAELYGIVPADYRDRLRRARGDRAHRRRQRASTSSRRSTATRSSAASRTSRASRSGSSPTTASSSPRARSRAPTSSSSPASAASRSSSSRTSPASWSARSTRPAASPRTAPSSSPRSRAREVPKFTVIIGGSFGAGNYGMCGRAYSPRQLWMWPNARICVMGGEQAAIVLSTVGRRRPGRDPREVRARGQPVLLDRAALGRRHHRPARHPQVLALGIAASLNAPIPETTFGVFRM